MTGTNVSGINTTPDLVGQKGTGSGSNYQAFLLNNNGATTNIGPEAGYTSSFATGINASGQVVGYSQLITPNGLEQLCVDRGKGRRASLEEQVRESAHGRTAATSRPAIGDR